MVRGGRWLRRRSVGRGYCGVLGGGCRGDCSVEGGVGEWGERLIGRWFGDGCRIGEFPLPGSY